jgi:16S rRNA (cytidine1402-2'-O)-methyltransferase
MSVEPGSLYLLPSDLGDALVPVIPGASLNIAHRLSNFIAENPKSARAFLKRIAYPHVLSTVTITTLDKDTPVAAMAALLQPLRDGIDVALVSEAGCPAVADPGALLVRAAHEAGFPVVPLVGPSAILLALMASGLNGQRFSFHGYLPVDAAARAARIRELEQRSKREDATQIFIETPYRNDQLLQALLEHCTGNTLLCIAADLTQAGESIATRTIAAWRKKLPALNKRPAVFLLYRNI